MLIYNKDWREIGNEIYSLMAKLYPICRSITGDGLRKTLNIINELIPIKINEVPTGTKVFDWVIPDEWNIKDAYIKNLNGEKIIDFKNSNLHVLNYSIPINKKISLEELKDHLYTLPDHPDWIPYLTSYYSKSWGFCLTQRQLELLQDDFYEVFIDSKLEKGFLSYGELYIKGELDDEILFSCYICHPSLCNDNLSGTVILTFLAKYLLELKEKNNLKYSYRFLFIPETIGAITWLSKNEKLVSKIKGGLVATCCGDAGKSTYKRTRKGNNLIDEIVEKVLIDSNDSFEILDFWPSGSDERQFSSPGFNLPIGSLMRTVYDHFPEYHTSADNLDFIKPIYLADSYKKYVNVIYIFEYNKIYLNLNPKCEPQLGKRGLYSLIGSSKENKIDELTIYWILNLSDSKNSLLDISIRSKISFGYIKSIADVLYANKLLKELTS